jgi:hypothetical protein
MGAIDRTSAQPQLKLSFLRSISLLKIDIFLGPEMATHVHKITNVPVFLSDA